jgi:hypothetical protein
MLSPKKPTKCPRCYRPSPRVVSQRPLYPPGDRHGDFSAQTAMVTVLMCRCGHRFSLTERVTATQS